MSDDDTRELPPVEPPAEDRPEATAEVATAQGAGATARTTEKDETMTIEPATPEPPTADDATVPLPRADDATLPLPKTQLPPPPAAPTGPPPRTEPPADAYAAAAGHIRVMSTPAPVAPVPPRHLGLRVGTVVWGLVVAAVAVGLLSIAWGAHLDAELAFIVLLGAAGVALLVGSLVGMRRSRTRVEGRG